MPVEWRPINSSAGPRAGRIDPGEWEKYHATLLELYAHHSVMGVMDIMSRDYNFRPSRRQYISQFERWGFVKYKTERRTTVGSAAWNQAREKTQSFDTESAPDHSKASSETRSSVSGGGSVQRASSSSSVLQTVTELGEEDSALGSQDPSDQQFEGMGKANEEIKEQIHPQALSAPCPENSLDQDSSGVARGKKRNYSAAQEIAGREAKKVRGNTLKACPVDGVLGQKQYESYTHGDRTVDFLFASIEEDPWIEINLEGTKTASSSLKGRPASSADDTKDTMAKGSLTTQEIHRASGEINANSPAILHAGQQNAAGDEDMRLTLGPRVPQALDDTRAYTDLYQNQINVAKNLFKYIAPAHDTIHSTYLPSAQVELDMLKKDPSNINHLRRLQELLNCLHSRQEVYKKRGIDPEAVLYYVGQIDKAQRFFKNVLHYGKPLPRHETMNILEYIKTAKALLGTMIIDPVTCQRNIQEHIDKIREERRVYLEKGHTLRGMYLYGSRSDPEGTDDDTSDSEDFLLENTMHKRQIQDTSKTLENPHGVSPTLPTRHSSVSTSWKSILSRMHSIRGWPQRKDSVSSKRSGNSWYRDGRYLDDTASELSGLFARSLRIADEEAADVSEISESRQRPQSHVQLSEQEVVDKMIEAAVELLKRQLKDPELVQDTHQAGSRLSKRKWFQRE